MPHVLTLSAALLLSVATAAPAQVNSGAYLAGRQAVRENDFRDAAAYLTRAMIEDDTNGEVLDSLAGAFLSLGELDRAATIARKIVETEPDSQVAGLILTAEEAEQGEWDALIAAMEGERSVGPLFDRLATGWALIGRGDVDEGLAAFDAVTGGGAVRAYGVYHKALALASLGRFDEAAALLDDEDLSLTRRGIRAHVQILTQIGRSEDAVAAIDEGFGDGLDPILQDTRDRAVAGEPLDFTIAPDARAGIAEVVFSIANALSNEVGNDLTLLYSRAAEHLVPGHVEATLLSAALLEQMGQYDLAIAAYGAIPGDSGAAPAARMGRAEAMRAAGDDAGAVEALEAVVADYPDLAVAHVTLADTLRELERFAEARDAYDAAVALFDTEGTSQWVVYFSRAVASERMGDWPAAEADFRRALELNPEQPTVLNYLGYSLVERRENLDEALDMIERAVAARPNSGYIVDSLGWVFYRLGRYKDAVEPMERAVALMPTDPVVNDHLGDVYWAVGREREARFQWSRALSFIDVETPSQDVDPDRIRAKLEVGLDRVLQDEGADPLRVSQDAGGDDATDG